MNTPANDRRQFTLWQLFVVVTVICFLLALLGPMLLQRRERPGNRADCTNNIRQLALGVHMYHDVHMQLPPLATDDNHWSWIALGLPYIEGGDVYRQLQLHLPAASAGNLSVVRAYRPSVLACPSRGFRRSRSGGLFDGAAATDYVAVSTTTSLSWSTQSDGAIVFRAAPPTASNPLPRSATTFSSVIDSSAFTAMIGEKHMRADWLGGQYDEPALVAIQDQNTIRVASDTLGRGLAQMSDDPDPWKFGSAHPRVVLFAMVDASVKPLKNNTDPSILRLLCCRNDRTPFELP
jgi:hypothetical protein